MLLLALDPGDGSVFRSPFTQALLPTSRTHTQPILIEGIVSVYFLLALRPRHHQMLFFLSSAFRASVTPGDEVDPTRTISIEICPFGQRRYLFFSPTFTAFCSNHSLGSCLLHCPGSDASVESRLPGYHLLVCHVHIGDFQSLPQSRYSVST